MMYLTLDDVKKLDMKDDSHIIKEYDTVILKTYTLDNDNKMKHTYLSLKVNKYMFCYGATVKDARYNNTLNFVGIIKG